MIPRKIYKDIQNHLFRQEITFIVGPRQSGKTTLMRLLEKELKAKGERTFFST
jgi:hypothetical protein